jgi:hypothetical protein
MLIFRQAYLSQKHGFAMPGLTRRFLLTGAGLSVAALHCPACLAKSSLFVKNVLCATQSSAGLEIGEPLKTTGSRDLDQSLITEMTKQSGFFGFRPAFILYRGGEKNAAATTETWPETPNTQGTILYNIEMLAEQLQRSKWGGAILAGVIAHEFGHIYQYFSGYMTRLSALDKTVKFVELHADFLSGFYMGGKGEMIDVKPYADAFFRIGDYEFNNAGHHGTPEERYFVLKAGYNLRLTKSSAPVSQAAKEAENLLKEYIH